MLIFTALCLGISVVFNMALMALYGDYQRRLKIALAVIESYDREVDRHLLDSLKEGRAH